MTILIKIRDLKQHFSYCFDQNTVADSRRYRKDCLREDRTESAFGERFCLEQSIKLLRRMNQARTSCRLRLANSSANAEITWSAYTVQPSTLLFCFLFFISYNFSYIITFLLMSTFILLKCWWLVEKYDTTIKGCRKGLQKKRRRRLHLETE